MAKKKVAKKTRSLVTKNFKVYTSIYVGETEYSTDIEIELPLLEGLGARQSLRFWQSEHPEYITKLIAEQVNGSYDPEPRGWVSGSGDPIIISEESLEIVEEEDE